MAVGGGVQRANAEKASLEPTLMLMMKRAKWKRRRGVESKRELFAADTRSKRPNVMGDLI